MLLRFFMILVLALAAGAAGPASARDEVRLPGGRWYLIALPEGVAHPPLILALHGGGGNPRQFARNSGLEAAAPARGYAVAFPAGTARGGLFLTWNAGHCCGHAGRAGVDDVGFLAQVIADARARYGVGEVFVTGMSNGAMMAATLAAERPDQITAAAWVAGTLDLARHPPRGRVPVLHLHGGADPRVPFAGGQGETAATRAVYPAAAADVAAFAARWPGAVRRDEPQGGLRLQEWRSGGKVVAVLVEIPAGGHEWFGGRRAGPGKVSASRTVLDWFGRWR